MASSYNFSLEANLLSASSPIMSLGAAKIYNLLANQYNIFQCTHKNMFSVIYTSNSL